MLSALHMSHQLLDELILTSPEGNFIDATLGKGHDLAFILKHPSFNGQVFGFDIQEAAIDYTRERISTLPNQDKVMLYQTSHSNIEEVLYHVPHFHSAIFNLGYLPGGDHDITTLAETTIQAIRQILDKLVTRGRIIIVVYWGHVQGKVEKESLLNYVSSLDQSLYSVASYQLINQINAPPMLVVIEKK